MIKSRILDIKEELIENYYNGMTIKELSIKYNFSKDYIRVKLREWKVKFRKYSPALGKEGGKKYEINHQYFNKIDTHEKAYIVGFICADGCLIQKGISITQKASDSEILEKFKQEMESTIPLGIYEHRDKIYNREIYYTLRLNSRKMYEDLNKIGVTERKTHTIQFPNIPEEFYNSFILGVFDGDGCLYTSKNFRQFNFSIVGNLDFLVRIKEILDSKLNLNGYIKKRTRGALNIVTLQYTGKPSTIKILS